VGLVHPMWERKGGRVHAFLLEDDAGSLTMIDALYATDGSTIFATLARIGKEPTDIENIILTHAHRSHIGGLKALKEASGATVWADQTEADIISGIRNPTKVSILPRAPFRVLHLQWGLALGFGRNHPAVPVDQRITDGAHIGPVQAIHTPGHTPGSFSFWWPEERALFAGDIMVTWPRLEAGWKGLTLDNPGSRRSLGSLADLGDVNMVCVGHGPPLAADCPSTIASVVAGHRLPGLPLSP